MKTANYSADALNRLAALDKLYVLLYRSFTIIFSASTKRNRVTSVYRRSGGRTERYNGFSDAKKVEEHGR